MQAESKRKTLICPGCGTKLLKVVECTDLMIECFYCGALILATILSDGGMSIDYKPCSESALCITEKGRRANNLHSLLNEKNKQHSTIMG